MHVRTRRLRLLGLLTALLMLAAACGGGDETATTESEAADAATSEAPATDETAGTVGADAPGVQALRDKGTIRVGVKFDQPLFGLQGPGGVEGFDAEIAKLMVEGIFQDGDPDSHIEFIEAVSANREPFLQNDEVDMVIATYTMNAERDEVIDFAGPYYKTGQQLMVPSGNPDGVQSPEDLNSADLTTCSVEGSTSLQNFQELAPDGSTLTFDTYTKCAEAMADGRVNAVTTDGAILFGLVDEFGDFEVVGDEFSDEPYGIGIPDGATDVRLYLNERICQVEQNGEWDAAFENTVGVVAETPEPPELDPAFGEPLFPEGSECPQASAAGAGAEMESEMESEMMSEPMEEASS